MNEQIFPSDPRAAQYRTDIHGWVSRKGIFFGDDEGAERVARFDGSTATACEVCGTTTSAKHRLLCDSCREKARHERWLRLPVEAWTDGPVCIHDDDVYFFNEDEFHDWCEDNEADPASLDLVLCMPILYPEIGSDFFENCIPEDCDMDSLPQAILDAVDAYNTAARSAKPISWEPRAARPDMAIFKKNKGKEAMNEAHKNEPGQDRA